MVLENILVLVAAGVGIWMFKKSKTSRYPHRLFELQQALNNHADLLLHRNHDEETATELSRLAEHLKLALQLPREPAEFVRQHWMLARPHLLHLTSEDALKRVDLFYSDRREPTKAALYDLIGRLDKMYDASKPNT